MSEVQSRPARGGRGRGRGGFRGSARGHASNGHDSAPATTAEDNGEIGQLKKKYADQVTTIQEMFPDWTDADVVFALQENDGDLMTTVDGITDGSITQWGEVSKAKKDRSRSKAKETTLPEPSAQTSRVSRGGRAGFDGGRGGGTRGRGVDRGRGGRARGASAAHTNGSRNKENEPATEAATWESTPAAGEAPAWETNSKPTEESSGGWGSTVAETAVNATSSIIPDGVKKSWASMFTKPTPAPAPKKAPEPVEKPIEPAQPEEPTELPTEEPEVTVVDPVPALPELATPIETPQVEPDVNITPSKDDLTEGNLEQIPDVSAPAPTATAASTTASSWDPRNASAAGTPYSTMQSQPQAIRPPTSGFQASALKATGTSGRTPSFQRRVLDQEEAVRMPGNREVDRAAVQFGAFNLNGGDEDVDGEREEPETRAQPPQHSPVAPRAALPPAPISAAETYPTPKQSTGLPSATHPTAAPGLPSPQPLPSAQGSTQQASQGPSFNQYGRYGQPGAQEPSSLPQKPYDAFSQQAPSTQSPFEGYPSQQAQSQPQQQAAASAPDQFSTYYTSDPQRNASYNSYYQQQQQQYGLQQGQGQQDGSAPQRSFSGYNGPQAEGASQYAQSAAQQAPSRYATAGGEGSGHNTPNPAQQQGGSQGSQPQQPGHPQQPQAGNYPYGHPYYSSPYYSAYMNQYQQYGGGNYGAGPYGAKGGMHQPYQGYGMSPAGAPYEHASSPAAAGAFGASSLHGRDSALGGGLGEYGRAGSAQAAHTPQGLGGSGAFGGGQDPFARQSFAQGQNQQHYGANQSNQTGSTDDLKPFGSDSKTANGPSPSLSQVNRPGSAANNAPGSGLPPPQSQQGGYGGGYPGHLQQLHSTHGSSYGSGLGGAGGHQAAGQGHQASQYGGYQGYGGFPYGNNQQQQQQQQRGGWGGNYGGH